MMQFWMSESSPSRSERTALLHVCMSTSDMHAEAEMGKGGFNDYVAITTLFGTFVFVSAHFYIQCVHAGEALGCDFSCG
jgi:hypothetical protein